ncbi:hypothetical protein [Agrilutibacter solisilvae]|uniref:Uncharacterized protein n=1 Tax=Agrilutibacter solisilvae TaxID=2763317 RepID=A0A974XZ79_9GAMM|nr:hypothetical protein [Lysobacter solisilvae]QSX78358.1 hypothetical protein I8J32_017195 [Lysobacter solisilvae]
MNAGRHTPSFNTSERIVRSLLAAALIAAVIWSLTGNASPEVIVSRFW